jgi:ATPase subunit of ABC transporter with duplicated ATPase domains
MQIALQNAGKRFNRDWIFRHVDIIFIPGQSYAITGPNGAGKSTLLQLIGGSLQPSEGKVSFIEENNNALDAAMAYTKIAIAAPYMELIEEMTAKEQLEFHIHFKKLTHHTKEILSEVGLHHAADKQIRYFSSGMKQRLKLALAFFSNEPVILLDEPLTNLDKAGIDLYHRFIEKNSNKTIIISSNDAQEYSFCNHILNINSFKS